MKVSEHNFQRLPQKTPIRFFRPFNALCADSNLQELELR